MYGYLYGWLIIGSNLNQSISILNDTAYGMATDVVVAVPNENGYEMYDVFNHCKYRGGLLNVVKYGTWTTKGNLNVYLTEPKLIRRRDFNGLRLKIAGVVSVLLFSFFFFFSVSLFDLYKIYCIYIYICVYVYVFCRFNTGLKICD